LLNEVYIFNPGDRCGYAVNRDCTQQGANGKTGEVDARYALRRYRPMHRTAVNMCDKKLYQGLRINPSSYPFETYLPWHASLVTGLCEARGTTWRRAEPWSVPSAR